MTFVMRNYKLRCSIRAHHKDVRGLAIMDNCIVTGSSDNTSKLWTEFGLGYEQTTVQIGHTDSITSVCVLPPSEAFELGLIITGGYDKKILGYVPYTSDPVISFTGHTLNVCCLVPSIKSGCFLSGSWDGTARIWDVTSSNSISVFLGHTATVWSVLHMPDNFIITGSSDKNIKIFYPDGTCIQTLFGHTDCVRGLAYLTKTTFISCANDGTLRKWNMKGDCLEVYKWEDHFIYSIASNPSLDLIAFGGESHKLTIVDGSNKADIQRQVIEIPCTNIWAVGILPNSDIVTGTSDGFLWIFTKDPSRYASDEELLAFSSKVDSKLAAASSSTAKSSTKSSTKSSAKPKCKLPGKEILLTIGNYDGEVKVFEDEGEHYCYVWNGSMNEWVPFSGSVSHQDITKQLLNGKEYDLVFSIDVEDDQEPLKLPYNFGEDPATVAKQFVSDHKLPTGYTGMIIDFILQHTANSQPVALRENEGGDVGKWSYYPPESFVFFEQQNEDLICRRLDEFMGKMGYDPREASLVQLQLKKIAKGKETTTNTSVRVIIEAATTWSEEYVYPILDFARIAARSSNAHPALFGEDNAESIYSALRRFMKGDSLVNNRMFVCKILSNMFAGAEGIALIFKHQEELLEKIPALLNLTHKGLEISVTTFLVNMCLASYNSKDTECGKGCARMADKIASNVHDQEAVFRFLVAVGTLSLFIGNEVLTNDVLELVRSVAAWELDETNSDKCIRCARVILKELKPAPLI